jgi:hypothetical protein
MNLLLDHCRISVNPIVYRPDKNIFGLKLPGFFMKAGPPGNIEALIKSMGGEGYR